MSKQMIQTSLAALATAAMLTFAGLANAVIYNSHFDPLGSVTFAGDALFQFDNSCLAINGFHTGASCHAMLLSATVDMTEGVGNSGHLDFSSVLPSSAIVNILISGGNLAGVNSDLIGWVFPAPCTGVLLCGNPWWIQWTAPRFSDPVFLYTGSCDGDACFPNSSAAGVATIVTFSRVPEPGTLYLIAGALFAGWVSRKRTTLRSTQARLS